MLHNKSFIRREVDEKGILEQEKTVDTNSPAVAPDAADQTRNNQIGELKVDINPLSRFA